MALSDNARVKLNIAAGDISVGDELSTKVTDKTGINTFTGTQTFSGQISSNGGVVLGAGSNLTGDRGTATAAAGAATLNKMAGTITSEALTTAAGADYTLTLTNSVVAATSIVLATVDNGTNTTVGIAINRVTPAAGSVVILVRNTHAASALNGTVKINFFVVL